MTDENTTIKRPRQTREQKAQADVDRQQKRLDRITEQLADANARVEKLKVEREEAHRTLEFYRGHPALRPEPSEGTGADAMVPEAVQPTEPGDPFAGI
jgi:hypothetical protein